MKTFPDWCKHYDYDPSSKAAAADYAEYLDQLSFFQQLKPEPEPEPVSAGGCELLCDSLQELQDMCKAACVASHDAAFPLERKYHEGRAAALVGAAYVLETAIHKAAMSPANDALDGYLEAWSERASARLGMSERAKRSE